MKTLSLNLSLYIETYVSIHIEKANQDANLDSSRNTLKTRPQRTTRVLWIYVKGKSTVLSLCAFSKKPTDLTPSTSNRYAQDHPGADPYELETLKGFVRTMAYGIDGASQGR